MVLFTCLAICGFATTWGPLAWVVCAEIFPSRWKGAGMGVATATNWTFNFLIGFFTTSITAEIGYDLGWVFSGSIIVGSLFVWFCVHETQGKSLEEIDLEILSGDKPWKCQKGK
jgi:SP family sugar:H+ symporter-like MFS transporter